MTDDDGLRIEAADQLGFKALNDDMDEFSCTVEQLLAFAKACECAGMRQAERMAREAARNAVDFVAHVALNALADSFHTRANAPPSPRPASRS